MWLSSFFFLKINIRVCIFVYICSDASGAFKTFGSFHGGLGAWNTASNTKISIEYISNSFVGGLFPILNGDGSMEWNNSASIVITDPMNSTDWIRATLVSISWLVRICKFTYLYITYIHIHITYNILL